MTRRIEFSPEALGDLIDLYDYIAVRDGAERAIGYIDRIEEYCRSLSVFPDRGVRRDDLRPGLRILGSNAALSPGSAKAAPARSSRDTAIWEVGRITSDCLFAKPTRHMSVNYARPVEVNLRDAPAKSIE